MKRRWNWLVLVAWGIAAFSGCGGCGSRGEKPVEASQAKPESGSALLHLPRESDSPQRGAPLMELAGEVDGENRYLWAVKVTALSGTEEVMACSGTALSHHVVATAGHCVCAKRALEPSGAGQGALVDASTCLAKAKVETIFYEPQVEPGATLRGSQSTTREGRVQPHPGLRVVLDEQGKVSSSHADLALIFLSQPLEIPGVPLADEEVQEGEPIVIVGRGYDELTGVFGWERRFSLNRVSRLTTAADDRILIEQPGGHHYREDSGGPCLRQEATGPRLVGISSRWLGEGAAFTSIHGYRAWLRDAVLRGESANPAQR